MAAAEAVVLVLQVLVEAVLSAAVVDTVELQALVELVPYTLAELEEPLAVVVAAAT